MGMGVNKVNPNNPDQFACDECGRWFNHQVLEIVEGHGEVCTNCCVELGIEPVSFPEQRVVDWKARELERALANYNDAVDTRDVALEKIPESERPKGPFTGKKAGLGFVLDKPSVEVKKPSEEEQVTEN
jgi:hypothetical protein